MDKEVYDLKVNSMTDPTGVDSVPLFSWKMRSKESGAAQAAYRILVTESGDNIWDSGVMESDRSFGIKYAGKPLSPRREYLWRVILKDENGAECESREARFETGLMSENLSAWNGAEWIGAPSKTYNTGGITRYRFSVDFEAERCGIALAARDRENYYLFDINMVERIARVYEYNDKARSQNRTAKAQRKICGRDAGYAVAASHSRVHHLIIEVDDGIITLLIDGAAVIGAEKLMSDDDPLKPYRRRMFMFGFRQDEGEAYYDNLKIKTADGTVLVEDGFDSAYTNCARLGEVTDGRLRVKKGFALTSAVPAVNVRKICDISGEVQSARLYAAARGFYDVYVNGKKVNDSFYNPGFTDYHLRIQYQTYDITKLIKGGENVIGAVVGSGYYSGFLGYNRMPMIYGAQSSFLAMAVITYFDGREQTIVTDSSWQFTDCGPVICDDYLNGEIYDARREFDWSAASLIWRSCGIIPPDKAEAANGSFRETPRLKITPQRGLESGVFVKIRAKYVGEAPKGHFVYDLGQNIVGTVTVRVKGARGAVIKLRYGEFLRVNGEVYLRNLRAARATDVYILSGSAAGEEFTPTFTSHGFRYIEASGDGGPLEAVIESIDGVALSNTRTLTGHFECSDSGVNQLYQNIVWGQAGNSLLIYTDCPQRNERMGWTGDAQIFARTAAYNMDVSAFMGKWLRDMEDAQTRFNLHGGVPDTAPLGGDNRGDACAGWGDAAVIVPWEMYRAYGDEELLRENYAMMKKWVKYMTRPDRRGTGIRVVNGLPAPEKSDISREPYLQIQQRRGDHLTYDESTPFILTATAYSARSALIMARVAEILGEDGDRAEYERLFEKIKRAFNDAWVKEDGSIAYWGEMSKDGINKTYYCEGSKNPPSQTAYAVAIRFGLIDGEKAQKAGKFLRAAVERRGGALSTGFLGVAHLNPALTMTKNADTAYSLLLRDENPSWLYSVRNGATTVWERWDSYIAETDTFGDAAMNSFNHYSYGAVGEWLFESVIGISPLEAGYKRIKIEPVIGGGLAYAKGYFDSPRGRIESGWKTDGNTVTLRCVIPPNASARIVFGGRIHEVSAGEYEFAAEI